MHGQFPNDIHSLNGIIPAFSLRMLAYALTLFLGAFVGQAGNAGTEAGFCATCKVSAPRVAYSLPIQPETVVVSSFSESDRTIEIGKYKDTADHWGVDFSTRKKRRIPVLAAADGVIAQVFTGCPDGKRIHCGGGLGNFVRIQHADGRSTYYAHLSPACKIPVKVGKSVAAGSRLGCIGKSGRATDYHLCFRVKDESGNWIHPEQILKTELAKVPRKEDTKIPNYLAAIVFPHGVEDSL